MGSFNSTIITEKGHNLIAKLQTNTATMSFTKIKSSEHDYSSLTSTQLEVLTSIEDIKQETLVSNVTRINDASVKVSGAITNTTLTTGYYIKTIALYANDPDEGEVLYSVTVATESDWMPPYNNVSSSSILVDLITVVSNAENVSIDVDPTAVATVTQLNEIKHDVYCDKELLSINHNLNGYPVVKLTYTKYGAGIGGAGEFPAGADSDCNLMQNKAVYTDKNNLTIYVPQNYYITNPSVQKVNDYKYVVAFTDSTRSILIELIKGDIEEDITSINNNISTIDTSLTTLQNDKANNTDNTRTTTDKTVTGAINELNTNKATKDGTLQTNLNAEMLGGKKISEIPTLEGIKSQPLEIGEWIDFHKTGSSTDYDARLSMDESTLLPYWNGKKILNEDDYNTLNDLANSAFQSASNGKINIANAITGKGISANSGMTYNQLASAISAISTGQHARLENLAFSVPVAVDSGGVTTAGTYNLDFGFQPDFVMLWTQHSGAVAMSGVTLYWDTIEHCRSSNDNFQIFPSTNGVLFRNWNETMSESITDATLIAFKYS